MIKNNEGNNKFSDDSSKVNSAVKLFENTSIFKSLFKIVTLAIIVSLATGIYVFVDQILMVRIIPLNHYFSQSNVFGNEQFESIKKLIDEKSQMMESIPSLAVSSIVRTSVSLSSPLTLICTAISLLLGLGTSIAYSKDLGKKDYKKATLTWSNGFYNTLITSLITSAILIGLTFILIPVQANQTNAEKLIGDQYLSKWNQSEINTLQNFLNYTRNLSINWAVQYSLIIIGFNVFNNYIMLFISLLNSEGKNAIPTAFILISNVLNIALDFALLYLTTLGINAAAIATVISWIIGVAIFVSFIWWQNKKKLTLLEFKYLKIKEFRFDYKIILYIFAIGIASFFRNASTAVYSLIQQSIYGQITQPITGKEQTYYLTILGAVNPIYNLFFSAIIGVIRGARTVITYNYVRNEQQKVQKAYLISMAMAFVYAFIFFIIVSFILQNQFLWLFDIIPGHSNYNDALILLRVIMGQLLLFSFTISGMLYFQSTGKPIRSIISSIMYGTIIGIPGLFIASEIAKATNNMDIYIYSPLIIISISGLLVFTYSTYYVFKKPKIYIEY
ncbi:MATE family efflux transporter [Malacoplasma iowae]|uniref:Na+-driven multidrug efflux pump n=1 Tax=Malacoplasma iowae DK-CPA TaxID=1394179 RepID=A0A084U3R3_MALIO|nr:MATE family efflux transporter [Malacoplasma iowae]KFB07599.1 Na+-driven multidrug efflux pump [Malacoplasma iowae DK-CPA]WPL36701.1 MATE family efflux transporter [Malacoplasma iowae]WPL37919.1 MATE family efflux transporter [Malacoplasma iowae]WPL41317.1 MATE family efflux transporter [Malacoplasma iowae]